MSDTIISKTPLWVAYVSNPAIDSMSDTPVTMLAAGKNIADAVLQCATEADTAGHDDLAKRMFSVHNRLKGYTEGDWSFAPEHFTGDLMSFGDGEVEYFVQKIHNLDDPT